MTSNYLNTSMGKRNSMDIVKQIHATKPKSVFLDGKPTMNKRQFGFSKGNKVGLNNQGLQSIRRAAFATETNDEVHRKSTRL